MHRSSFFLFLCLGMLTVLYGLSFSLPMVLVVISGGCLCCAVGIVTGQLSLPGADRRGFYLVALGLGLFLGLFLQFRLFQTDTNHFPAYSEVTAYNGTLYRDSLPASDGGWIHYLQLSQVTAGRRHYRSTATGRVVIFTPGGRKYYSGQFLELTGKLEESREADTHFFSYIVPGKLWAGGFTTRLAYLRSHAVEGLEKRISRLGSPSAGLFMALFLGAKEQLTVELTNAFTRTGTLHILALSGLHVGIIYLLMMILLLPLTHQLIKFLAASLLICAYLFLVGPRPSLLRAGFMLLLLGVNRLMRRQARPLNLLALAAVLILIQDPTAGRTLSFQLSFLALLGIILIGGKLTTLLAPFIPQFLLLPLACSLGAQFATAPLILYNFGQLYPSGILVTLLLIPIVTVFIWTGLLFLLPGMLSLGPLSYAAVYCLDLLYRAILFIASFFSTLPAITCTWKSYYSLIYVGIFALSLVKKPNGRNQEIAIKGELKKTG